jgi:hypothetical protein
MSTEWIQIIIVCAVFVPLVIGTGAYLRWRRWDRERREVRQARLFGLREFYDREYDLSELEVASVKKLRKRYEKPGFSVKA